MRRLGQDVRPRRRNSCCVGGRSLALAMSAAATLSATGCGQHQLTQQTAAHQAAPTASSTPPVAPSRCSASQLSASIRRMSGAGGHMFFSVVFTNGGKPCALLGYPGMSFLDADRRQLGGSAYRVDGFFDDAGKPPGLVPVPTGGRAHAVLRVDDPGVPTPADCHRVAPKFLRIYPPGSRMPIIVSEHAVTAMCLLYPPAVGPVRPGDPDVL